MSKAQYITGLRAVEQLLASGSADVRRLFAEYQTANPRVEAIIKTARDAGIDIQPANRARLTQISGEGRHQGVVAEVRRSSVLDEAALRSLVEERLVGNDVGTEVSARRLDDESDEGSPADGGIGRRSRRRQPPRD